MRIADRQSPDETEHSDVIGWDASQRRLTEALLPRIPGIFSATPATIR
jgi:hypothetical protein